MTPREGGLFLLCGTIVIAIFVSVWVEMAGPREAQKNSEQLCEKACAPARATRIDFGHIQCVCAPLPCGSVGP